MTRDHDNFSWETTEPIRQRSTRGEFIKAAGVGAATAAAGSGIFALARAGTAGAQVAAVTARAHVVLTGPNVLLAATDGYMTMPGREGNPVYIFGFIPVTDDTIG